MVKIDSLSTHLRLSSSKKEKFRNFLPLIAEVDVLMEMVVEGAEESSFTSEKYTDEQLHPTSSVDSFATLAFVPMSGTTATSDHR